MKIKGYIDINRPRELVTRLFINPEYLGRYQDTFLEKKHLDGTPGHDGATSLMYYKHGKQEMELKETIVSNKLPESFYATYHHMHMDNTMEAKFTVIDENTTRYYYTYEYTRINWLMPRLISILFPSMYSKPAKKWLKQFKEFVEGYKS